MMLNIKYCPQRYDDDTFNGLLDDLIDYNAKENKKRYKKIPEFHLDLINEMEIDDESDEKINKKINKAYEKFPWHFEVKRLYFFSQINLGNELDFYDFFKEEIECFESGAEYSRVISDIEFTSMISLIGEYYEEVNEKEKLKNLYKEIEKTQYPEFYLQLALLILNKSQLNYATIFDPSNEDIIGSWLQDEVENEIYAEIHFEPRNSNFYKLLNTGLGYLDIKDIEQFDHLENKEDVKNDILWLLKQGLTRAYLSNSNKQLDFINLGLYLTSSYEISELYDYFIELFHTMTENISDLVFGDFTHTIVLPAFLKIFKQLDENDFDFLRSDYAEAWFIKSNFLDALGLLCAQNGEDHYTRSLFKNLFIDWEKAGDHEMIGWLFCAIENRKVEGFDNEINNAFDKGFIDIKVHGAKEDWLNNIDLFSLDIEDLTKFSHMIDHCQKSFLEEKEIGFEEALENFILPYRVPELDEESGFFHDLNKSSNDDSFNFEDDNDNIRSLWDMPSLPYKRDEPKVGRNDACPCGSGKKYKKCCGE